MGFFGLPENYRTIVRKELFDLAYHGNGGFPISALYDMPVYERKFYLKLLNVEIKKQNDRIEQQQQQSQNSKLTPPPTPERYKNLKPKK